MTDTELSELINNGEFKTIACQYTLMYMARVYSQAEFLSFKVLSLIDKVFSKYEATQIIEAFMVKTLCDWEWYVEKIICDCLKVDTSNLSKQLDLKLPKTISTDECIAYLNGLGYFDLKSCSNLKSIAKKILIENTNPFQNIHNDTVKYIDDYYILRNYIAHKSNKSKKALMNLYNRHKQVDFIEVGDFMLTKENDLENVLRIQKFEGSFWAATFNIMESLFPKTYKWVMRDEKVYNDECQKRFLILIELSPNKPKQSRVGKGEFHP